MELSAKTLARLTDIITGEPEISPCKSGRDLIDFFREFGERDLYGQDFPARSTYTLETLRKFNGTARMKDIVCRAFDFFDEDSFDAESAAAAFNGVLKHDGFSLVIEYRNGWMQGSDYIQVNPYFELRPLYSAVIDPKSLFAVSHQSIAEQVAKSNSRLDEGDYSGAISSAYTLVEELIKLILLEKDVAIKNTEGDIRALFKHLRVPLNLDPSMPNIATPMKPILEGLQKVVAGLYEVANKAGDRHARQYNPAGHHAKLAINAAFVICEFLIESCNYQEPRT